MEMDQRAIQDGEQAFVRSNGGEWISTWHEGPTPPDGTPHGASAVCVTSDGDIVLMSRDGENWGLPGGRPEGHETWEETMRREVLEEICATVVDCRLLGFSRGHCQSGHEQGLVLVRSTWRADVILEDWKPQFEIPYRSVFPESSVRDLIIAAHQDGSAPLLLRALNEALGVGPHEEHPPLQ
jgi:hypothetical protein